MTPSEVEQYDSTSMFPWLYGEHMYIGVKSMAKLAFIIFYMFLADRYQPYTKLFYSRLYNYVFKNESTFYSVY